MFDHRQFYVTGSHWHIAAHIAAGDEARSTRRIDYGIRRTTVRSISQAAGPISMAFCGSVQLCLVAMKRIVNVTKIEFVRNAMTRVHTLVSFLNQRKLMKEAYHKEMPPVTNQSNVVDKESYESGAAIKL